MRHDGSRSEGDRLPDILKTIQQITCDIHHDLASNTALSGASQRLAAVLSLDYLLIARSESASTRAVALAEFPAILGPGGMLLLEGFDAYYQLEAHRNPVIVEQRDPDSDVLGPNRPRFDPLQLRALLLVPLITKENLTGFVMAGSAQAGRVWGDEELAALETVAAQLAASLHSAALLVEIQRRADQLDQLTAFGRLVTSTLDRSQILQHVVEIVPNLLPVAQLHVGLLSPGQSRMTLITLSPTAPPQEEELAAGGTSMEEVVQTQNPILVPNLQASAYTDHQRMGREGMRAAVVAPLTVSGRTLGAVSISHPRANLYTTTDLTLVQQFANQIAIALENARQFQAARQRAQYEEVLSEITSHLQQQTDVRVMLQQTMQDLGQALKAHRARVRLQVVPPEFDQPAK